QGRAGRARQPGRRPRLAPSMGLQPVVPDVPSRPSHDPRAAAAASLDAALWRAFPRAAGAGRATAAAGAAGRRRTGIGVGPGSAPALRTVRRGALGLSSGTESGAA